MCAVSWIDSVQFVSMMNEKALSNRRFSSRIKKKSIYKIESEESEAAFDDYQSAVDKGEITTVYSKEQDTTAAQVSQIFDKCTPKRLSMTNSVKSPTPKETGLRMVKFSNSILIEGEQNEVKHFERDYGNNYEKRSCKQTEKGRKSNTGNEIQKKKNQSKNDGSCENAYTCTSCKENIKGNEICDYCSSCSTKFHLDCLETFGDQRCCIECMSRAKWDEVEEVDSPLSYQTPRTLSDELRNVEIMDADRKQAFENCTVNINEGQSMTEAELLIVLETSNIEGEILDLQKKLKGIQKTQSTQIAKDDRSEAEIQTNTMNKPAVGRKVSYTLDMKTALTKKRDACDRAAFSLVLKNNCGIITLSTAAFELFRSEVSKYLTTKSDYAVHVELLYDQAGSITQDIIKVKANQKKLQPLFTINCYRTTGRIMVNGPAFKQFTECDLPLIKEIVVGSEDLIQEKDQHIKECIRICERTETRQESKCTSKPLNKAKRRIEADGSNDAMPTPETKPKQRKGQEKGEKEDRIIVAKSRGASSLKEMEETCDLAATVKSDQGNTSSVSEDIPSGINDNEMKKQPYSSQSGQNSDMGARKINEESQENNPESVDEILAHDGGEANGVYETENAQENIEQPITVIDKGNGKVDGMVQELQESEVKGVTKKSHELQNQEAAAMTDVEGKADDCIGEKIAEKEEELKRKNRSSDATMSSDGAMVDRATEITAEVMESQEVGEGSEQTTNSRSLGKVNTAPNGIKDLGYGNNEQENETPALLANKTKNSAETFDSVSSLIDSKGIKKQGNIKDSMQKDERMVEVGEVTKELPERKQEKDDNGVQKSTDITENSQDYGRVKMAQEVEGLQDTGDEKHKGQMAKRHKESRKLWNTQGSPIEDPSFKLLLEKLHNLSGESSSDESDFEEEEENIEACETSKVLISQEEKGNEDSQGKISCSSQDHIPTEGAVEVRRVSHQSSNSIVEDPCKYNDVSPKPILPEKEAEFFIKNEELNEFQCKLCKNTSKTIGGIKTHISRTHKIQKSLTYMPKLICCKCNKEIKREKMLDAGQCTTCKRMEHYRCSMTNKKYVNQFKDGSLPFKCSRCCLPGIGVPKLDLRSTSTEKDTASINPSSVDTVTDIKESIAGTPEESGGTMCKTSVIEELQKHNVLLTAELKSLMEKEAQTDLKMKLLIADNNQFRTKLGDLQHIIITLQNQESDLVDTNADLRNKYKATVKELDELRFENEKAKEVAQEVQNVMTKAIKEANLSSLEKDKEIERLEKENQKWKAENCTYKELLSPHAMRQRAISSDILSANETGPTISQRRSEPLIEDHFDSNDGSEEETGQEIQAKSYDGASSDENDEYPNDNTCVSKERESIGNTSDGVRYCHFYNRNGCRFTDENCRFLHDVAPICVKFLNGRCTRKLCMYRHQKAPHEETAPERIVHSNQEHSNTEYDTVQRYKREKPGRYSVNKNQDDQGINSGCCEGKESNISGRRGSARFCHFYNRNGCANQNCQFLHEIAPACGDFLNGTCTRRLCMYRHEKDFHDGRQTFPASPETSSLHTKPKESKKVEQKEQCQMHQDTINRQEIAMRHHRKRYLPSNPHMQRLSSYSHNSSQSNQ